MAYALRTSRYLHRLQSPPTSSSSSGPDLEISADGHYFVDTANNNAPFLMNGIALWSGIAQLNRSRWDELLDVLVAKGINSVRCSLVEAYFSDQTAGTGIDWNGQAPWTGTPFQSSLNTTYWNEVEWKLDRLAEEGMIMLAFPAYCGIGGGAEGWWLQGMKPAGAANMQAYGASVGEVLNAHSNAIIVVGGDYWVGLDSDPSEAANLATQDAMVTGLKSTDRAGRSGEAILFIAPRERNLLRLIEKHTRQTIDPLSLPTAEDVNTKRLAKFKATLLDEVHEIDEIVALASNGGAPADIAVAIADLLGDIVVYCRSEALKYGLPLEEVLDVIMDSNASKLGADGHPIYDANGKFLKGPNYWKPEPRIKALLEARGIQLARAAPSGSRG